MTSNSDLVKDLLNGIRKDGKSVVECCLIWNLTDVEYQGLLDTSPELQRAHTVGEMHCASWWHQCYRELALKGNASALTFAMKNISKVGWVDKPENKEEKEIEPLREIKITLMEKREPEEDDHS
jgi:hypothetical protein